MFGVLPMFRVCWSLEWSHAFIHWFSVPLALFSCIHLFLSEFIFFFPDSNFAFLCPFCLWFSFASSILLSLFCSSLLFSSTCFPIRYLSPSFFFVQLCLLALLSSSPRIRCWSLSTCSYSSTQTLPTFSHRSFLWFFLSFSFYSYTKAVTMSLLALMRTNSTER